MKTKHYAPALGENEICDCGHPQDAGHPYNGSKMGWKWAYSLDGSRRLCHACQCKQIADCGHEIGEHSYITSGTAHLPDGREVCTKCADDMQREELRDTSKPFTAYLSGDGSKITTWTGGELMRTIRETDWHIFGSRRNIGSCVKARDVHGHMWAGRGAGRGMCITLRPCKA